MEVAADKYTIIQADSSEHIKRVQWHSVFDPEFDTFQFMVWHKTNPAPKIRKAGFLNSCELIVCVWNKGHVWNFIKLATEENGLVYDPFMGVGSTGVAALRAGRKFLGVDLEEHYVKAAAKRLQEFGDMAVEWKVIDKSALRSRTRVEVKKRSKTRRGKTRKTVLPEKAVA